MECGEVVASPATHPLRHPPKGDIWLHVDRFGKANGAVWALQYWERGRCRWRVARDVTILAPMLAENREDGRQPRAGLATSARQAAVQWRSPRKAHIVPRGWLEQEREGG